jgi:hypothetical protein
MTNQCPFFHPNGSDNYLACVLPEGHEGLHQDHFDTIPGAPKAPKRNWVREDHIDWGRLTYQYRRYP